MHTTTTTVTDEQLFAAERAILAAVEFMHSQAQIGHDITGALACVMERQEHLASLKARRRHPAFRTQS